MKKKKSFSIMSHLKHTLLQGLVLTFPWSEESNAAAGNSVCIKISNTVHNSMGSLRHESPNVGNKWFCKNLFMHKKQQTGF
jgi:hypothetical protein